MGYIYSILAVLTIGFLCLLAIRFSLDNVADTKLRKAKEFRQNKRNSNSHRKTNSSEYEDLRPILKKKAQRIPTPWGWQRHRQLNAAVSGQPEVSGGFRSLSGRLTREKELLRGSSNPSKPNISNSMRALLEDRYSPVNHHAMEKIKYEIAKAPLLRDPKEPFDQLDNFDSRQADLIRKKLQHVKAMNVELSLPVVVEDLRYVDIKDVKQPWGW